MKIQISVMICLLIILSGCYQVDQSEEEKVCGTIAGIICPEGYRCEISSELVSDASGVCEIIDEKSSGE